MKTLLIASAAVAFLVIAFLVIFFLRALAENRRLRDRQARVQDGPKPANLRNPDVPPATGVGAYSYNSIVMDEVLGEKLIEELKKSLRMTEEMYQQLTERFKDDRDRRIELANDWLNYLEVIDSIKQSRIDYHMNSGDGESLRREQENSRVKLEIENKFKHLQQSGAPVVAG